MGIPATGIPIEDKNALNLYLTQRMIWRLISSLNDALKSMR
ncbi:hypothetical protein JCM19241_2382 [Vibrio ishigakensis]|uniref:Uncharacterized protein n=1 Tax=Vibrio ishigakensis TaxID=1481914 RepID=A0A0B8Q7N7_9VIBR|nr:hypothetical protein JCM19241_2382 [Vibrio ishigakensis]